MARLDAGSASLRRMIRAALAATAAALQLGVSGPAVTAGGSPMFPVLFYYQCGASALAAAAAGADFFVQQPYTACSPLRPNDFAFEPLPVGVRALTDDFASPLDPAAAGWYLPDEPDATLAGAAGMPTLPPAAETGRLR